MYLLTEDISDTENESLNKDDELYTKKLKIDSQKFYS